MGNAILVKRIIPIVLIFVALFAGYKLYMGSIEEDFKNVDMNDVARVGDAYTGIFHRVSCPKVETIKSQKTEFANTKEAEAAGFSPCKRCKP